MSCGPPGVYRLTTEGCPECTEMAGVDWNTSPEGRVQRECVSMWLGRYYGVKRYFECLHTCDDGIIGVVTIERYTVLRVEAEAVSELWDAYLAAENAAYDIDHTEAEEKAACAHWDAMGQEVIARHQSIATYVQALEWTLSGHMAGT